MKKSVLLFLVFQLQISLFSQNWTAMAGSMLPVGHAVHGISAIGDNIVWAIGSLDTATPPIPSNTKMYIIRSSDGGQNWIRHEIEEAPGVIAFSIVAVDSLTAWITTQDYGSGPGKSLYVTTDGGITWSKKSTNGGAGVSLLRFSDGQHWLAHNRQGVSRSTNNGGNWLAGNISGYQPNEYQILLSGTNMACSVGDTSWNGTSAGRIIRFTNFGSSPKFIATNLGTASNITSVAFHDHLNGLLYFNNFSGSGKLARSTDGGNTWAQLSNTPPGTSSVYWNIIAVPGSPGTYVMVTGASTDNGRVATTKDFGNTWSVETIGENLNSVIFTSPTTGWAGAGLIGYDEQPTIFKYTGAPIVDAKTPAPVFPAFSVSPNPADDLIWLDLSEDFQNLKNFGNLKTSIHDAAGRLVFSKEISNNPLNVSDLKAGIYFLKIEGDGKSAAARFVKN